MTESTKLKISIYASPALLMLVFVYFDVPMWIAVACSWTTGFIFGQLRENHDAWHSARREVKRKIKTMSHALDLYEAHSAECITCGRGLYCKEGANMKIWLVKNVIDSRFKGGKP